MIGLGIMETILGIIYPNFFIGSLSGSSWLKKIASLGQFLERYSAI
jgi:hypothetical protein